MKIKVLLVAPGMEVQKVKIPASTKYIKSFLGNDLTKLNISNEIAFFANKNPNIEEFNRLYRGRILMGPFFIIGMKNQKLVSLKKRQVKKYMNMFKLSKHKKVNIFKEEFLEQYYYKQRKIRKAAEKENKQKIFGLAA